MAVLSGASAYNRWQALTVGSVVGGGSSYTAAVEAGIRRLVGVVRRENEALPEDGLEGQASVNVIFHVPGTMLKPDYSGMRTGRFVKAKRLQIVQVAVPEGLTDPFRVAGFLSESLTAAVDLAAQQLARRKVALSLDRARTIAHSAAALLRSS